MTRSALSVMKLTPDDGQVRGYSTSLVATPVAIRVTKKGLEAGLDHLRAAASGD